MPSDESRTPTYGELVESALMWGDTADEAYAEMVLDRAMAAAAIAQVYATLATSVRR